MTGFKRFLQTEQNCLCH